MRTSPTRSFSLSSGSKRPSLVESTSTRNAHDGKYFGMRVGRNGRTDPVELARAANRLVMIRTALDDTSKP